MPNYPPAAKVDNSNIESSIPGDSNKTRSPKSWRVIKIPKYYNLIFKYYSVYDLLTSIKLRINTKNKPIPIKPNVKVARKLIPIINVLKPEAMLWAIGEE